MMPMPMMMKGKKREEKKRKELDDGWVVHHHQRHFVIDHRTTLSFPISSSSWYLFLYSLELVS